MRAIRTLKALFSPREHLQRDSWARSRIEIHVYGLIVRRSSKKYFRLRNVAALIAYSLPVPFAFAHFTPVTNFLFLNSLIVLPFALSARSRKSPGLESGLPLQAVKVSD